MKVKPTLLIIGNSNVGKSSITRLLLPNPRKFKGKIGKSPGSTLLVKPITQPNLKYKIIDLPGFGYASHSSQCSAEERGRQVFASYRPTQGRAEDDAGALHGIEDEEQNLGGVEGIRDPGARE